MNNKSKIIAILLAWFLGGFGIHKFYLGKTGAGIFYLLFFWTFVPSLLALIDIVVMLVEGDESFNKKYNKKQ